MNKGFLFATSSRKIKSHAVERQITFPVWTCFSLTEKQRTINHRISFDNLISNFYECTIRGFCQDITVFFSICLGKKHAEAIQLLGILKKYVSQNKIYFCLKKKSNIRSSLFIQLAKIKQQNEWIKTPGVSEYGP